MSVSCLNRDLQKELVTEAVRAIFPWCMTHNHATRAFAQLTIDALMHHIKKTETLSHVLTESFYLEDQELDIWTSIRRYLMENKEFVRLKKGLGRSLMQLNDQDAQERFSPRAVFSPPGDADEALPGFEAVPACLLERLQDFLAEERLKVRDANNAAIVAKENGSHRQSDQAASQSIPSPVSNVQRKITTSDQLALMHSGDVACSWLLSLDDVARARGRIFDAEDQLQSCISVTQDRQSLIIVASLIDKTPNLAGLARTCEVFRAESLVISDRSITKTHQFTSISVTAEAWLDIEEVKPVALHSWLLSKKSEGYHLIGVEQTSSSQSLPTFQFPKQSVLVLGREKEGIPADLLNIIDATVEIPQLGVIRSLNVHVSGALAIYEYTRQHNPHCPSPSTKLNI